VTRPRELLSAVGSLTLLAPMQLGSGQSRDPDQGASKGVDSLVMRDRCNRPYVPGTSLAGLLREATRRLAGKDWAERLFGSDTQAETKTLSRIEVSDAVAQCWPASPAKLEVRQHVGIRRDRQTARDRILYNHEVAPRGLGLRFELQAADLEPEEKALLDAVLDLLGRREGAIGGRKGSGLGQFALYLVGLRTWDLASPDDLCEFLLSDADARWAVEGDGQPVRLASELLTVSASGDPAALEWCRIDVTLTVTPDSPLLVKSPEVPAPVSRTWPGFRGKPPETVTDGDVETYCVETQLADGTQELYIPGSSLRGVLRSRAEKIIRTMAGDLAAACDPTLQRFAGEGETLSQACGQTKRGPDERDGVCLACQVFGCTEFAGRVRVAEGIRVEGSFDNDADQKLLDHVAIDRFTGSPVHRKKFVTRPLMKGCFCTSVVLEGFRPWELGLVAYLLKDLHERDLRLGFGKAKGFGKVQGTVTSIALEAAKGGGLETLAGRLLGSGTDLGVLTRYSVADLGASADGFLPASQAAWRAFLTECARQCDEILDGWAATHPQCKEDTPDESAHQ
jgi:CRISPR/Cas system CSM-associated protein Csm3 (group 7 of RAMP superfamily)